MKLKDWNSPAITENVNFNLPSAENSLVNDQDKEMKGDNFEKCVVDLFPKEEFTIVEWTTDVMRKHHRYVEADTRPDLKIRHNLSGDEFYVECKFRSGLFKGGLQWCKYNQLERYRAYSEDTGLPLFIAIGLGGMPHSPERMFCIPIKEARYPNLYPSVYENFERDPERLFFWKNGMLE